jgi:hypothetical protein
MPSSPGGIGSDTASRASTRRTTSTYSRTRRRYRVNGSPYQPSDTCGPLNPSPSRKRPSESTSNVAAAIAVAVGLRAGICMTADPSPTRSVRPASSPRTETASWPHASLIHTESSPSSSARTASDTCSSAENHGQYARKSPIRIGREPTERAPRSPRR